MPKKYGVKEKDLVVSHVVNLVLTGKLRSEDRLDRNEIAQELGLSRVPVQEAVVQLEHDGILSTRYHRGAYVERFDESMVALARVTRMPLAAVVYVAAKTDCSRQDGQQHARCRTSLATPDGDPSPTAVASEPWALRSFFAGEFRRRNRGDYALWDAAKRAISEEASRAGAREKLATFQAMLRRTREGAERCALSESVPSYPNGQYAACLERLFPLPPRG